MFLAVDAYEIQIRVCGPAIIQPYKDLDVATGPSPYDPLEIIDIVKTPDTQLVRAVEQAGD